MIGLYVHVPYCTVRCSYCDFHLVPRRGHDLGAYVDAVLGEIDALPAPPAGAAADTVHFGGGTPSLLPAERIARVLAALRGRFRLDRRAEIALEANPEDLDDRSAAALAQAGVSRLTVGVQSLDDARLRLLRRPHDAATALAALAAARRSGVPSVAADLILGLPGQGEEEALDGVERLVDAGVDHLSLYLLEIHPRTRLGRQVALGSVAPPDDEPGARMYEEASRRLERDGFEAYEISNFAKPGHRSRHNLKYWTDQEYLGFGPSAHSYRGGRRWANAPRLREYVERRGRGIARLEDEQPASVRGAEALAAGLRLADGVDLDVLRGRYGDALPPFSDPRVHDLSVAGLLEVARGRVRLTRRGRLVSNEVIERLLPDTARPPLS